jgi:hypothetical protein
MKGNGEAAIPGQVVIAHPAPDVPHKEIWIEIFRAGQVVTAMRLRPSAHAFEDGKQGPAGLRQSVNMPCSGTRRLSDDDPGMFQLLEALRQQGARHSGQPAP